MNPRFILLSLLLAATATAREVGYDLVIDEAPWAPDPTLRPVTALTVNGGIPGPTLRFRVGDTARIRVTNQLDREETSVHWHGILLPNAQDGVPHVTTPPIAPGSTHPFVFRLTHPGTYWYHSHTGLQEQRGVYGAIVVEAAGGEAVRADRDHVVVLSDWTRERPEEVMRTLLRGSDWYAFRKGTRQSVAGAWQAGALPDFLERERSRMPAMDVSDVAYDAFLANGRPVLDLPGRPGETVRLRVINAGASTYFYLQSSTGPLRIVAADGPAVRPIDVNRLLIGMAETYDLIVTLPSRGRWEVRATAQDGSGHASIRLGSGDPLHAAPELPKPDPYRMDAHLMAALEEADGSDGVTAEPERPLPPYARLRSRENTAFAAHLPRRELELRLTGDMERYLWSFNDRTAAEDGVIPVRRGEVLRVTLINDTMMHHPLHLHGHFFRVVDDRERPDAPLKHTLDVPPMGTRVIEFEASETGDWLFHCHLLYHMHAGMARVFSYTDQGPGHLPDLGEHAHDPLHFMIEGSVQSHMSMGMAMARNARNDYYATWDIGYPDPPHVHYEIDLGWSAYLGPNLSAGLGARLTDHHDERDRAFAGIDHRLPYLVDSFVQVDSRGDFRIGLGKSIALTDRLGIFAEVHYDTGSEWEWTAGAEWLLTKELSLISQYHSDHGFGGGLSLRF